MLNTVGHFLTGDLIEIVQFTLKEMLKVFPVFVFSVFLGVLLQELDLDALIGKAFSKRMVLSIILGVVVGAFEPLGSCMIVPIIVGLLLGGVPLPAIMAFWVASPGIDPEIFTQTVAFLGWPLAITRLVAVVIMSLAAGLITWGVMSRGFIKSGDVVRESARAKGKKKGLEKGVIGAVSVHTSAVTTPHSDDPKLAMEVVDTMELPLSAGTMSRSNTEVIMEVVGTMEPPLSEVGCQQGRGGALEINCPICQGRCGRQWQHAVVDSWDFNRAHWRGRCGYACDCGQRDDRGRARFCPRCGKRTLFGLYLDYHKLSMDTWNKPEVMSCTTGADCTGGVVAASGGYGMSADEQIREALNEPWWKIVLNRFKEVRWLVVGREVVLQTIFLSRWLILAFVIEESMFLYVPSHTIISVAGHNSPYAVPIGGLLGCLLFFNNIQALPIVAGLKSQGMQAGAVIAFLLTGPATTIPALLSVWSIVKPRIFWLHVGIGLIGALLLGYLTTLLLN